MADTQTMPAVTSAFIAMANRTLVLFLVGLIACLTVVDLFATQAILPMLAQAYAAGPSATGLAALFTTIQNPG